MKPLFLLAWAAKRGDPGSVKRGQLRNIRFFSENEWQKRSALVGWDTVAPSNLYNRAKYEKDDKLRWPRTQALQKFRPKNPNTVPYWYCAICCYREVYYNNVKDNIKPSHKPVLLGLRGRQKMSGSKTKTAHERGRGETYLRKSTRISNRKKKRP